MIILIASALLVAQAPATQGARASDATEHAADPQDKVICKRFEETGSLVGNYRVCKTKREWERGRDNIRAGGPGVDSCGARANGGPC